MAKNYTALFLTFTVLLPLSVFCQDIKIFRTTDFDLKGNVKKCLVRADYGKEEYEFNKEGLLTKSVTRYSEQDYDITYYKYQGETLLEKRLEVYRDNVFDENTSIANFYSIDTTANRKVIEKIVSYSKEFLGQYEYLYDADQKLVKIIHSDNEGTDETEVAYTEVKDERTKIVKLNGILLKTIRTSEKKVNDKSINTVVLTKNFIDGNPSRAVEEVQNPEGLTISKTEFYFDEKTQQFAPETSTSFFYDENGVLKGIETKRGEANETKEYIYQFDEAGNWVKEIVTPDNAYKTREISYYKVEKLVVEE